MKIENKVHIKQAVRTFSKEMEEIEPFLKRKIIKKPHRRGSWERSDITSTQVRQHDPEESIVKSEAV